MIQKGTRERVIRTVPIGKKPVFFKIKNRRFFCHTCGALRHEELEIADPKKHYDRKLERFVAELCQVMTIKDVARHVGLSWNTVKEIDKKRLLRERPTKTQFKKIGYLGVNEVAIRKGHRYLTICVDLETGAVVHVGKGRKEDALLPFLKRLRRFKVNILAIATDMWPAYLKAIKRFFSQVPVIFDRYHIMVKYSRLLDKLRAREYKKATETHKKLFKGVPYLLLAGAEKLTALKTEKLSLLLELNEPISKAYILKEDLRMFWNCRNKEQARSHLLAWMTKAVSSGIRMLKQFAKSLRLHLKGLLAYFKHPISTARVEGINNKIKVLKRKAYGYRDMDYFTLRIYNANKLMNKSATTFC